jgi:RNA polymerase sigma-70 factor, ECF subfamily
MPVGQHHVGATSPGIGDDAAAELRLLQDTALGSEAAFRTLVNMHLRSLLAIGRRMLGETAEAEDMAQEALLRLWRGAGRIEIGPSGLRPWLNRVAANLCLDRLRARKIMPQTRAELPEVSSARGSTGRCGSCRSGRGLRL